MAPIPDRLAFRPDIEGLRGIAILLVVAFHAGVPIMRGGFVGVDVFFVLSGFFITGILARELEATGEVDAVVFYAKRALRLLPALLLVLVATLVLVFLLYAPIDRAAIADTARWVALYAGNVSFAAGAVDYFWSGDNPLLHTWSLAVEEQFYVFWPVVVMMAGLLAAIHGGLNDERQRERTRRRLFVTILVVGTASFLASLWLTRVHQPWAFFSLPARAWEFALGGALALLLGGAKGERAGTTSWLQLAGLVAIGIGALTYEGATPYPGTAALLPALGACCLVVGGDRAPASALSGFLSGRGLRWLGRLSYAWYLWHWPLVGLGAVLDPSIGPTGRGLWSVAALGLAWLTHRFLEQPVRDGLAWSRIPERWVLPGALVASVAVAGGSHLAMRGAQARVAMPDQRAFALAREDRMEHDCWANTVEDAKASCALGDRSAPTTLALLGDSHAEHWLGALDRYGREHGMKIEAMVKGGCPVPDMPELTQPRLRRWYHECTRYREAMLQRIVAMRPDAVVLSSWDHYFPVDGQGSDWQVTPDMWRRGLSRTYQRLSEAGLRVIVIRGTPRTWFDVPACLSRRAARLPFAGDCTYDRMRSLSPLAIEAQDQAARGLNVAFIDMNDQVCDAARCDVVRNGTIVFTDDNHLTASFSRSVAPALGARLEAAMGRAARVTW